MAARHAAFAVEPQPHQYVAAERLNYRRAFAASLTSGRRSAAPAAAIENLLDQRQALFDLANTDPYPCIDVAGIEHGHVEGQFIIGRIGEARDALEGAARGAADITAGAELACAFRFHDAVVTVRSCNDAVLS